jgi:hypothetical protein
MWRRDDASPCNHHHPAPALRLLQRPLCGVQGWMASAVRAQVVAEEGEARRKTAELESSV